MSVSATKLERAVRSIFQFMNTTYGRNFYAMSESAVHEEREELEQENTVKYFSIAPKRKSIVFLADRNGVEFHFRERQGRNANEEGLLRTKLNFLSYLPRIKLVDVKEKGKRGKEDQEKQLLRYVPQF